MQTMPAKCHSFCLTESIELPSDEPLALQRPTRLRSQFRATRAPAASAAGAVSAPLDATPRRRRGLGSGYLRAGVPQASISIRRSGDSALGCSRSPSDYRSTAPGGNGPSRLARQCSTRFHRSAMTRPRCWSAKESGRIAVGHRRPRVGSRAGRGALAALRRGAFDSGNGRSAGPIAGRGERQCCSVRGKGCCRICKCSSPRTRPTAT